MLILRLQLSNLVNGPKRWLDAKAWIEAYSRKRAWTWNLTKSVVHSSSAEANICLTFPAFYGTRRFIPPITTASHVAPS
jgi:hypothetical protein